jgi:hypothetical protein
MYIDNLTIAGILVVASYGLVPLLFRRELLRVTEDLPESGRPRTEAPGGYGPETQVVDCGRPEPCG